MSDVDTNMFASDDAFGIAVSILVKHVFHSSSMDWRYWNIYVFKVPGFPI